MRAVKSLRRSLFVCLVVVAASPWVIVVSYETVGHRHNQAVLDSLVE